MKTLLPEQLRKIYASEEEIVQRTNYVLELLVVKADLAQQETDKSKAY